MNCALGSRVAVMQWLSSWCVGPLREQQLQGWAWAAGLLFGPCLEQLARERTIGQAVG